MLEMMVRQILLSDIIVLNVNRPTFMPLPTSLYKSLRMLAQLGPEKRVALLNSYPEISFKFVRRSMLRRFGLDGLSYRCRRSEGCRIRAAV